MIDKIKEEINSNNHKNMSELMKQEIAEDLKKFSESETSVGQFASYLFKNNGNYLIRYLNALIHGITKVADECYESLNLTPEFVPELITFKIGDLMRCKCSSK